MNTLKKGILLRLFVVTSLLMIISFLQNTAPPKTIVITEAENGQRIVLTEEQVLLVKLKTDFSAGYRWEIVDYDRDIISAVRAENFEPDLSVGYSSGTQNLAFKSESCGETGLKIVYYDSKKLAKEPLKIFDVAVLIKY